MYNLSDLAKRAFQQGRQYVTITMDGLTITDEDILEGGLVINRSSQSGTSIEIGSVIAAEMALQLQNYDERFDNVDFEGKTMNVVLSSTDGYDEYSLPMGYFIIDEVKKQNSKVQITALDRMAAFDKPIAGMASGSLANTLIWCATKCGVPCQLTTADLSIYPNYNVTVSAIADGEHTYREILAWACECMGICAYADWAGRLSVGWYADTGVNLTNAEIKDGTLELAENAITITGVKVDNTVFGNDGYIIQITDNDFATENYMAVGQALLTHLQGFFYTPVSMTVLPMPWLWPLDGGFINGTQIILSGITFKINGYTALEAKGESLTKKGMASGNPLTRRESALVKALQEAARAETDMKIDNILLMNQLAAYSMGLYPHIEELPDGSKIFTYSDTPDLEDSQKVYRFNANGFFVSNDGGETWNSGLDSDGNLIVHILTADQIVTGILRDATGTNYWNLDTGELRMVGIDVGVGARNYIRNSNTLDFSADSFSWMFTFNGNQAMVNGNNMEVLYHA